MRLDPGQDDLEPEQAHQVTWFAPDRPVEQTIYVRPAGSEQEPVADLG